MQKILIYRGGCDLTINESSIMEIVSCLAARYDAGIVPHKKEHTGVIEIYKVKKTRKFQVRVKKIESAAVLRMVRTEEAKTLRKAYDNHEIELGWAEQKEAEPRPDGLSNTITTVQKDNMILEVNPMEDGTCRTIKNQYYKNSISNFDRGGTFGASAAVQIKQATKEGYIPIDLPGVANLSYPDSQTRRGRVVQGGADMSDLDNGEYP